MKKFLLSLVAAAAALFATSCVNELEEDLQGNANSVTFEISASELASRALGDAEQAVYLLYGVYEIDGSSVVFQNRLSNTTINEDLKFVGGNATVTINLLDDTSYNVLFWAVSAGTYADGITTTPAFTINWAEQTMAMNSSLEANVEGYDAFYGYSEGVAAGSNPEPVQLSRPFAQLNIGTNDLSIAEAGGFNPANSKVVLENAPKKFDLKNGTVTETGTITYDLASMNEVKNNNYPIGGYNYLSMNYVLVSGKALVNVTLEVNDGNNKTIDNTYNSVPVQRNYRTNVYGSLLTNGSQFNVTIDKGLSTEYEENHAIVKNGYQFVLALLRGENVILANNITVTAQDIAEAQAALNPSAPVMSRTTASGAINVVINLGGYTITFDDNAKLNLNGGSVTLEGKGTSKIVAEQGGFTNGGVFTAEDSEVDTTGYKDGTDLPTVSEGLAAVFANGGTFTMTTDIALTKALTVSANAILDLNGHVLSGVNNTGSGHLIKVNNSKSLTIKDSSAAQNGKITYAQGTSNVGWTIYVEGELNLESGAIELTGDAWSIGYGVDLRPNAWGTAYTEPSTFNMTGGKLISSDGAVRVASTSSESYKQVSANFNMTGGEIEAAYDGIFVQQSNAAYDVLNVNISGGTLKSEFYPIRFYGPVATSKVGNSSLTISGGSFSKVNLTDKVALIEGLIYLGGGVSAETLYYTNVAITGGTFTNGEALPTYKTPVAKIGDEKFGTLQEAIDAAEDGAVIVLISDIKQVDGVLIEDKNLTIDLDNKTYTVTDGASVNNRNIKVTGTSVVTIKNGTLVAEGKLTSGAYGTVRTEGSAEVELDNVKLYSYRGYGLNVKANAGTTITIKDSEIYAQYSGGVEAAGGTIELTNVKIDQKGVYSGAVWCSVAIGVNGGGTVTINSGEYNAAAIATDANAAQGTWVAYVMSSGGTLDIKGGTFNGTIAETANAANACGLICADRAAVVNIYDGTFNSNGAILDMRNNVGTQPNPVATLYGGDYSANPTVSGLYSSNLIKVEEGKAAVEGENGRWTIIDAICNEADLMAAFAEGGNIVLGKDITITETVTVDGKAVVLNLNGKTISGAFTKGDDAANAMIKNNATLTIIGGTIKNVTENGDAVILNKGTLTLDDVKIVGAPLSENGYPEYNIYSIGGSLVVEEGTEIVADRGAIRLQDGADVTINGGDIKVTDALGTRILTAHVIYAKGSKLTINNGNFAMKYNAAANLGASIICPAGATIKVYGGNFNFAGQKGGQSGCFQNYMGYGAPVDVYGGTYNDDTVTKSNNLADGYTAIESNGIWTVVKAE